MIVAVDVFGESTVSGWDVALALVALVVGWLCARAARRASLQLLHRITGVSDDLARVGSRVVYYFVLVIGIGVAISVLGADVAPLQTAAIIIGVIVVVALRGVTAQFAAGLVLQSRRPYALGDHIEALGYIGIVRDLTSSATLIETYDGKLVHLPNAQLINSPIVNRMAQHALRADIEVRVAAAEPLHAISAKIVHAAARAPSVLSSPAPLADLRAVDEQRSVWLLRIWYAPHVDGIVAAGQAIDHVLDGLRSAGLPCTAITPPPPPPFTPPPTV